MISRRSWLKTTGGLTLAWTTSPIFATSREAQRDPRFALIILRGGMDGLAAVPPLNDPNFRKARGELAKSVPVNSVLELDGFFGLHPAFKHLHGLFQSGELAFMHAVAPPYWGRSHFQAQDVLEAGVPDPSGSSDGWLYRTLDLLPGVARSKKSAIAVGGSVPLVLRGQETVGAWSPDRLPEPDKATFDRVLALYDRDPVLGPPVERMLETQAMAGNMASVQGNPLSVNMKAAAEFLINPAGPRIAVLDNGGWDTHANQTGQLVNRFAALDQVIAEFRAQLGEVWQQTVVLMVTEFGRTVAANGTRGTDHGVGGLAFVTGGAVSGGRVLGEWPGLGSRDLYEGRDLQPTTDMRSLFKSLLVYHLDIDEHAVDEVVFPGTRLPLVPVLHA